MQFIVNGANTACGIVSLCFKEIQLMLVQANELSSRTEILCPFTLSSKVQPHCFTEMPELWWISDIPT